MTKYNATKFRNGLMSGSDKSKLDELNPSLTASFELVKGVNSWKYEKSFSVAGQDTGPSGVFFSPDGTKMYILGDTDNDISQYNLSVAWDIGTATFFNQNGSGVLGESSPQDLYIRADGLKVFVVGGSLDTVRRYSMSVAWDITTLTYDGVSSPSLATLIPSENTATGLDFSPDGTQMFVCGTQYDGVIKYTLSTAWDVSTATVSQQFSLGTSYESNLQSVRFNSNGTIMYLLGQSKDSVYEFLLSSPWDISSPTLNIYNKIYFTDYTLSTPFALSASGIFISNNNAYLTCSGNDSVFQYDISNPGLVISGQTVTIEPPVHILNNLQISGGIKSDYNIVSDTGLVSGGNASISGDITVAGGDLIMSATTNNIGYTSTATNTLNISTGAVVSGSTKTINIGPNATSGSTTNITLGSAVAGALNTATVYGDMTVSGDLTVNGTTTTINTATLEVEDQNILVNKGGTDATAAGSGLTVQGTSAPIATFQYDSTLASKWKLGAAGSESEVIIASTNQTIAGSKRFVGELVFGDTTTRPYYLPGYATNYTNDIQSVGTSFSVGGAWLPIAQYSTSTTISGGAFISLNKSNNAVVGSHTIVNSGQRLGAIGWAGSDGSKFAGAADIAGEVDATPAAGSIPGRLVFYTTPSGATVGTERLRIGSNGNIGIGTTDTTAAFSTWRVVNINAPASGAVITNFMVNNSNVGRILANSSQIGLENTTGTGDLYLATNSIQRLVIDKDGLIEINGTGTLKLPSGTTAQRPASPTNGMIRYNSNNNNLEGYINNSWQGVGPNSNVGLVPLGGIIPMTSGFTGAFAIPASGTVSNGWIRCDGAAIPAGQTVTGITPNLSNSIYLRGASTYGTPGGSNTVTLTVSNLPAHTHANTLTNATVASSTHVHDMRHNHQWGYTLADNDSRLVSQASSSITNATFTAGRTVFQKNYFSLTSGTTEVLTPTEWTGQQYYTSRAIGASNAAIDNTGAPADPDAGGPGTSTTTVGITNASVGSGTAFSVEPSYIDVIYLMRVS